MGRVRRIQQATESRLGENRRLLTGVRASLSYRQKGKAIGRTEYAVSEELGGV